MNKSNYWIVLFFLLGYSCSQTKTLQVFSTDGKYITYDKVKLHLDTKDYNNVTLRGYIRLVKDSLICFKFYGPFSYEVISGVYTKDDSQIFDYINRKKLTDLIPQLIKKSGIVMDEKLFELFFLGNVAEMESELKRLNGDVLNLSMKEGRTRQGMTIYNKARQNQFRIVVDLKDQRPKKIHIDFKDEKDVWSVDIDYFGMTNEQKRCNFEF